MEVIIQEKKSYQVKEEIQKLQTPQEITKLAFHRCARAELQIDFSKFPNLQFLEIIGCSYLKITMVAEKANLKEVFFTHCNYIEINRILGEFPAWDKWYIYACKYVKFKGEIGSSASNISLKALILKESGNCEMFHASTYLPSLELIKIEQSPFLKFSLEKVKSPALGYLWFLNSNYIGIASLGNAYQSLKSFKFENCAFPKFANIDFSRFKATSSDEETKQYLSKIQLDPNPVFRQNVKFKPLRRSSIRRETRSSPEDEEFFKAFQETNVSQIENEARSFITETTTTLNQTESSDNLDQTDFKFCPQCGTKNKISAQFCLECGESFPS